MRVDEQRQNNPARQRQARGVAEGIEAAGRHGGDPALIDQHVDPDQSVAVRRRNDGRRVRAQDTRCAEDIASRLRNRERRTHVSRVRALSCQRCSNRCENALRVTKIAMPVTEISSSAANMRGMLSR